MNTKNFFGINPKLWIGQVAPNQTLNKKVGNLWGDRVKVRIMGLHPKEGVFLPDSKLPWAIILRPTSNGYFNRVSTGLSGGEFVVGFFLDDDCQQPCIIGVLAQTGGDVDISVDEAIQQQSTEFKRINTFHGLIQPSFYQILGGEGSGSQQPTQLPQNDFFKTKPS